MFAPDLFPYPRSRHWDRLANTIPAFFSHRPHVELFDTDFFGLNLLPPFQPSNTKTTTTNSIEEYKTDTPEGPYPAVTTAAQQQPCTSASGLSFFQPPLRN